jgi:CDGSH-type Zn-finger protein
MDDATKRAAAAALRIEPDAQPQQPESKETFIAFMNEPAPARDGGAPGGPAAGQPTGALDRWFRERQKSGHGAPRLLEIPNEAMVSNGGPLQVTGNITLVHEDGSVEYANHLSLCRCGRSDTKPLCNEKHLDAEFLHSGKFSEISEVHPSDRASRITMSLIKDGPITFRGRLRMHNQFGQECTKMRGSLCRCGQSASKPFCDGSHERTGFKSGR